ncbi:MAG: hypothetical protein AAF747_09020 [Planctomycetota bacterium]
MGRLASGPVALTVPRLSSIHTEAIADLAAQLRYSGRDALRRQIKRAEQLAETTAPDDLLAIDDIVATLTGYRDTEPTGVYVAGAALLADLSAFVEQLCAWAKLTTADTPDALSIDDVAQRWNVSRRTIERARRRGLIARRIADSTVPGSVRLVFMPSVIAAYETQHRTQLTSSDNFSRTDARTREVITRRARSMRDKHGSSLHAAAVRIAPRVGRSVAAVRSILERHDASSDTPIFDQPPRWTPASRRAVLSAWRAGIDISSIADRWGKSQATIRRVIAEERAALLTQLDWPAIPEEASNTGTAVITNAVVRTDLASPSHAPLHALLQRDTPAPVAEPAIEHARACARWMLLATAANNIARLPKSQPSSEALDRIETDLRHAHKLAVTLASAHTRLIIDTAESVLGTPIERLLPAERSAVLHLSFRTALDAAVRFNPWGRGRMAGAISPAVTKAVATWARQHLPQDNPDRAATIVPRDEMLPAWQEPPRPWQRVLTRNARAERTALALGNTHDHAAWLIDRFGLATDAPHTLAELAARRGITPQAAIRIERRALAALSQRDRQP